MAFELINKKHDNITFKERTDVPIYFMLESDKRIYFSAGAVIEFGFAEGLYVHFQNDEDRWYFYCNNDEDGFKMCKLGTRGRNAVVSYSVALVNLIMKRTLCSIGTKFPIMLTKSKFNKNNLLEICFNKPL